VTRPDLRNPPKPAPGDRIAVVSPGSGLPGLFPAPYELGLRRLREDFGLEPVEYPMTRVMGASPQARADDIHAAFADPSIRAVMASIGGDDQIKVLRHLDPDLLRDNAKPFFGFSDNTNLLHFLWGLGIVGFHGASVMAPLGRGGALHPITRESLHRALFTTGPYELAPSASYNDVDRPWDQPATLETEPEMLPCAGWTWRGRAHRVEGPSWGGNLEIIDWQLRANRYIHPVEDYAGCVLVIETSEELPDATYVYRVLMGMGERGLLGQFAAVMVGRAKAWSFESPLDGPAKQAYAEQQRAAVSRALDEYNPQVPTVFDVDLGHTDPQVVIPHGGPVVVDGAARRVIVTY
jgi:muramoyltetrapeptide carboxypeptidase LdcA involved in peptidoglycan recycling